MSLTGEPRIVVVAEDSLMRAGLAALVSQLADYQVVGQSTGDEKLTEDLEVYQPDLVVWDLGLDAEAQMENLASLHELDIPLIVIVPHEDTAGAALSQGARGVLLRDLDAPHLGAALQAVSQGFVVIDPRIADALGSARAYPALPVEHITPREMEVLQALAEGLTNKSIAAELGISEHTVKFHVNSIFGKLGVQSRTQAVSFATRLGLIKL